jgi:hypothetical protein
MYPHIFVMNNCTQAEQGPAEWNKMIRRAYQSRTKKVEGGAREWNVEGDEKETGLLRGISSCQRTSSGTANDDPTATPTSAVA